MLFNNKHRNVQYYPSINKFTKYCQFPYKINQACYKYVIICVTFLYLFLKMCLSCKYINVIKCNLKASGNKTWDYLCNNLIYEVYKFCQRRYDMIIIWSTVIGFKNSPLLSLQMTKYTYHCMFLFKQYQ